MKLIALLLTLFTAILWVPQGWTSTSNTQQLSSSRAYLKSAQPGEFQQQARSLFQVEGFRYESSPSVRRHCECLYSVSVWDAKVFLSGDADHDGYFHELKVDLDLDLDASQSEADVTAVISISFEGGPWNRLFTSNTIHLTGQSREDTYIIETHLESGYPTGIYDLLIEVFDHPSGDWLSSHGPNQDLALRTLPLESLTHDGIRGAHLTGTHLEYGIYGSGSLGWLSLLFLISVVFLPRRQPYRNRSLIFSS